MGPRKLLLTFCLSHLCFSADSFHLEALSRTGNFLDLGQAGGDLSAGLWNNGWNSFAVWTPLSFRSDAHVCTHSQAQTHTRSFIMMYCTAYTLMQTQQTYCTRAALLTVQGWQEQMAALMGYSRRLEQRAVHKGVGRAGFAGAAFSRHA